MKRNTTLIATGFGILLLAGCRDTSFPTAVVPPSIQEDARVHTGWIFGPDGEPIELGYVIIDGKSIHEGDINLGPAGTVPKTRAELLGRGEGPLYGVVIDGSGYRWSGGVVPYVISGSFDATQRQHILDALAHVAGTTAGTQFRARTTESSYLYFNLGSGCDSPVGHRGGAQVINLTSLFCTYDPNQRMGVAAHEILHSLGMWHEQSRCDRNSYIIVHSPYDADAANFGQKCTGATDYFSYSEGSIMHYGPFSPSGQRWISSLRGLDHLMGQRAALHQTDISTLNAIYRPYPLSVSIGNSGGTPLLSWTASNGATEYTIDLIRVYEEVNGYENWSSTYEEGWPIGTTSGTSLQDTQNAYTGQGECYLWNEWYGYARYVYYYEVRARFPDGISSTPTRPNAPVAPETC